MFTLATTSMAANTRLRLLLDSLPLCRLQLGADDDGA
jgi:hypothetical protein